MGATKDQTVREKFIEMRARGFGYKVIARDLSVSVRTLTGWSRKFSKDIERVRGSDLDALHEKYLALKKRRVAALVNIIEKAQSELSKRNFDQIPTGELLRLYIRAIDALKSEIEPLACSISIPNLSQDFTEALEPEKMHAEVSGSTEEEKTGDPRLTGWEEIIRRCIRP